MSAINPRQAIIIFLIVLIFAYAGYQGRALIIGPQVTVTNIADGEIVQNPVVNIKGKSRNVAWISLNGRQIYTDENGNWEEKLIVASGTSIITIQARDRFRRQEEQQLRIILN